MFSHLLILLVSNIHLGFGTFQTKFWRSGHSSDMLLVHSYLAVLHRLAVDPWTQGILIYQPPK